MLYQNNKVEGFTFLEVLMVLVIVGILAAITIPNLLGKYRYFQLIHALQQLESSVKISQNQAKRKGKTCKIKLNRININGENRDHLSVVNSSDPGESGNNYTGCLLKEIIFSNSITVENNIPGSTNKITFSHKGNTTTSGTIKLSVENSNFEKCLVISNGLGIIRTGSYENNGSKVSSKYCKKVKT